MTTKIKCRFGSDSDHLSRIQLEEVVNLLAKRNPKTAVEICRAEDESKQSGARSNPNSPARVAALMSSLEAGKFDALVLHASYLPVKLPAGVELAAVTSRLTPYDVIISRNEEIFDDLPQNSSVIANEIRREAQLLYYRPDLKMVRMKGSVDALIQKVRDGKVDAVILAAADVERLNRQDYVTEVFTNSICVPAAGQGCLAVLVRAGDEALKKMMAAVNDPASLSEITAERAFLDSLSLGESDPVGVLGSIEGKRIELEGVLALPDGREKIRSTVKGSQGREEELGEMLAEEILDAGGREILQELNII